MVRQPAKIVVSLLLCLLAPPIAKACPVIDGIFEREVRKGETSVRAIGLATLQKGNEYSYKFANTDNFQRADNVKRQIRWGDWNGTMILSCWSGTLIQETQETGSKDAFTSYITVIDKDTIEIVSNAVGREGRYVRVKTK